MSSFNALLSSLGGQQQSAAASSPLSQPPVNAAAPPKPKPGVNNVKADISIASPATKRKAEDSNDGPPFKQTKAEQNGAVTTPRPSLNKAQSSPAVKSTTSNYSDAVPYRGTAKTTTQSSTNTGNYTSNSASAITTPAASPALANGAPKPAAKKGGFASVLEKAKAAQEAAKAAGSSNAIRHKPLEKAGKLSTKERLRREQEERGKQHLGAGPTTKGPPSQGKIGNRSRSGTPSGAESKQVRKKIVASDSGYKGTMKKAPAPSAYKGTMGSRPASHDRDSSHGDRFGQKRSSNSLGKSDHGGYASWSDLDDAEDEEDYGSDASSDMEAGMDDVEQEEAAALRAARREDLEEQAREDAHQREKAERKRRLEAMAKAARGKQKF